MSTDGLELVDGSQPQPAPGAHSAAERAARAANLNLDDLERDDPAVGLPAYSFTIGGRDIQLIDPVELDWNVLSVAIGNPFEFGRAAMTDDDREFFETQSVPVWKMEKLMEDYQAYYDIDPGKAKG